MVGYKRMYVLIGFLCCASFSFCSESSVNNGYQSGYDADSEDELVSSSRSVGGVVVYGPPNYQGFRRLLHNSTGCMFATLIMNQRAPRTRRMAVAGADALDSAGIVVVRPAISITFPHIEKNN